MFAEAMLSHQEIRVCELILQGHTLTEIANEMYLAYKTVGTLKQRAFRKLQVRNGAQLQRLRIRHILDNMPSMPLLQSQGYKWALQDVLQS